MNETFLRYNDSIVQSGVLHLNPELASKIKLMGENFARCVKTANERTLDSDEEDLTVAAPSQKSPVDSAPEAALQNRSPQTSMPSDQSQTWGYTISLQQAGHIRPESVPQPESYFTHISSSTYDLPDTNHQSDLVRRYQYTVGEVIDQSRSMGQTQRTNEGQQQQQQEQQEQQKKTPLPFGFLDLPSREQTPFVPPYIFPVNIPAMGAELPPMSKSPYLSAAPSSTMVLSPIYSYSHQESSFARRLMRATLETAVLMLSSPNIQPAILDHIFKLSLPYLTLKEIRNRFKSILSRGVTEDLDWYATPFLHLGGAGTHYRRRDAQGKLIPMENTWTVRQIGPLDQRLVRLERVNDGQIQDLQGIDLCGFEGEWFDAHDVQGYLEEQWNCRVDPRSSFAECLIEDEDTNLATSPSLSRGSTISVSNASTPPAPRTFHTPEPAYGLQMSIHDILIPNLLSASPKPNSLAISFDQTLGLDLAPGFDMGFVGDGGYSAFGLTTVSETEQLPTVKQRSKKVAWVDVQKLINSKCETSRLRLGTC